MSQKKKKKKKETLTDTFSNIEASILYYKSIGDMETAKKYQKVLERLMTDMMKPKTSS
jgi:hypothetical protein